MPHVSSGGSSELSSQDEVRVFKTEGEEETEKRSSENLSDDKLEIVIEEDDITGKGKNPRSPGQSYTGSAKSTSNADRQDDGKNIIHPHPADRGICPLGGGYIVSPYSLHNGATVPSTLGGKVSMVQPPLAQLMMYNNEHFAQPPPAHMGIPPVHIDPKTGLPRPMYAIPAPPGQFPHPLYSPEFPQVQWQRGPGYPISSGAFSGPYTPSLINTSSLSRYGHPTLLHPPGLHPPGIPHPAIMSPGPKHDLLSQSMSQDNHRHGGMPDHSSGQPQMAQEVERKKVPHVKKPLNAFMLFMKEKRASVVAECTLKESAAINQILGRRWHALDRSEQSKYYDMARKEKELHLQLYPGWSARDNYAVNAKKKKRKKTPEGENKECTIAKKCRARFGLDQQSQWCKPCRRKKKCIRFMGEDGATDDDDCDSLVDSINDSDSNVDSPAPSNHSEGIPDIDTPTHSHRDNVPAVPVT